MADDSNFRDAVINNVDELRDEGLYILIGSTVFESRIMHSDTGRIYMTLMRPMRLWKQSFHWL